MHEYAEWIFLMILEENYWWFANISNNESLFSLNIGE